MDKTLKIVGLSWLLITGVLASGVIYGLIIPRKLWRKS